MTVRLSPHKVDKILRGYFNGQSQTEIAKAARVDQSSVSHYLTDLRETTAQIGLLEAAKEYHVMDEILSLRSLAVELYQSKLTVVEAKQGHEIIKTFLKLGIDQEQHLSLVKVCQEINEPGFIRAALKLSQLETQTRQSYENVINDFEAARLQIDHLEGRIADVKAEIKSTNEALGTKTQSLANLEEYFQKRQNEIKDKEAQMEKDLSIKMKNLGVEKQEVEEVARLKAELAKRGLNIHTILKLAQEFGHGNK